MKTNLPDIPKTYLLIGGIIGGLILIAVIILVTRALVRGHRDKKQPLPNNGAGIPTGWDAEGDARTLHDAMQGLNLFDSGYDTVIATLSGKTDDQLVAIYNEFNRLYASEGEGNLIDWFEDDFSGTDLTTILSYYTGLV